MKGPTTPRRGRTGILISVGIFLLGCGPQAVPYNSASGPDGIRDTAPQLYLNTSEDDRCHAEAGDNEDWRYMLITERGTLRVAVRIDNPRITADLFLHDGFGRPVDRLNVNPNSDFYEFRPLDVEPGRYYFRIACLKGQSVYTVSANFARPEQTVAAETIFVVEPPDEPVGPTKTKPPVKTKTEKTPVRQPDTPAVVVTKTPEPVVPETPSATPPKKVQGTITLVTPGDGGMARIVIRGIGTNFGIDESKKGTLIGRNKTVTLFSCEASRCQGMIEADQEELKTYNKVEFIVP